MSYPKTIKHFINSSNVEEIATLLSADLRDLSSNRIIYSFQHSMGFFRQLFEYFFRLNVILLLQLIV
jgi:hypothetical protein